MIALYDTILKIVHRPIKSHIASFSFLLDKHDFVCLRFLFEWINRVFLTFCFLSYCRLEKILSILESLWYKLYELLRIFSKRALYICKTKENYLYPCKQIHYLNQKPPCQGISARSNMRLAQSIGTSFKNLLWGLLVRYPQWHRRS